MSIIQFKRPDGKTCPGYLATPKTGSGATGFVVIQEWWGLNDQIKETADRLAEAGVAVIRNRKPQDERFISGGTELRPTRTQPDGPSMFLNSNDIGWRGRRSL